MGLINKIKNIFFDDDEDNEIAEHTKEREIKFDDLGDDEPQEETKTFMHRFKKDDDDDDDDDDEKEEKERKVRDTKELPVFEKEVKNENSPFVPFDDDEFENNKFVTTRTTSSIKLETKKDGTKKLEYKKYEINEEPAPKKHFKVSPIISPVYGILDKNYVKEDFLPKFKKDSHKTSDQLNVDTIRNKAFGSLADDIESTIEKIPTDNYDEEAPQGKTIDELLLDNIEAEKEIISEVNEVEADETDDDLSIEEAIETDDYDYEVIEEEQASNNAIQNRLEQTSALEILDEIEKSLDKTKEKKNKLEDDTFENDLFELIDSMYEDRKDGSK